MDEHLTTAFDFKNTLLFYYEQGKLSIDLIKELITKQRLCWITKEENKKLNDNGYRMHRPNPLKAYEECGIEIYDAKREDLKNIMIPEFDILESNPKARKSGTNAQIRDAFYEELKNYFDKIVLMVFIINFTSFQMNLMHTFTTKKL